MSVNPARIVVLSATAAFEARATDRPSHKCESHTRLGISTRGLIPVYACESPTMLLTITGHADLVWSVAFSPDSKRLASGGGNTIRVWELTPTSK
jgi:WD40 repeat protein